MRKEKKKKERSMTVRGRVIAFTSECRLLVNLSLGFGITAKQHFYLRGLEMKRTPKVSEEIFEYLKYSDITLKTFKINPNSNRESAYEAIVTTEEGNFNELCIEKGWAMDKRVFNFGEKPCKQESTLVF